MDADPIVMHLFLINSIGGTTVVFLLEAESGIVEFPRLSFTPADLDDEGALRDRIRDTIGVDAEISGFLTPPPGAALQPEGSRILLARLVSGAPHVTLPHVGWEWTSGAALVQMPFAPRVMVDELKSFMNV